MPLAFDIFIARISRFADAAFDRQHIVSIEGSIEEIKYVNPHTIMKVKTEDGQIFTAEWQAVAQLQRGNALYQLKAGDRIVMTGAPARDESAHLVSLLSEVRRPADGWVWTSTAGAVQSSGR